MTLQDHDMKLQHPSSLIIISSRKLRLKMVATLTNDTFYINKCSSTDTETTEVTSDTNSLAGYSSTDTCDTEDLYGWYEEEELSADKFKHENTAVRDAWLNATSKPPSNQHKPSKIAQVLNIWINPTPEVSMKMSSGDDMRLLANSMSMSCCVSGFRIVQLINGECCAEYLTVFCYGSRTYSSWKSFKEFAELAKIISHINGLDRRMFTETLEIWNSVQQYSKWTKCLRAPYLIEKTIALGSFMQGLFNESPTPGLLLYFVQNAEFSMS